MKNIKFKTVLPVLMIIALMLGCSKDNGSTGDSLGSDDYYISFKANGESVVFTSDKTGNVAVGVFNFLDESTNQYASEIIASKTGGGNFAIVISTRQDVEINTVYTNYNTTAPKEKVETYLGRYGINSSQGYGGFHEDLLLLMSGTVADCEIVFTEVSSGHMEGRFSGTWYDFASDNNSSIKITDGEFNVPRLSE